MSINIFTEQKTYSTSFYHIFNKKTCMSDEDIFQTFKYISSMMKMSATD